MIEHMLSMCKIPLHQYAGKKRERERKAEIVANTVQNSLSSMHGKTVNTVENKKQKVSY